MSINNDTIGSSIELHSNQCESFKAIARCHEPALLPKHSFHQPAAIGNGALRQTAGGIPTVPARQARSDSTASILFLLASNGSIDSNSY